MSETQTLKQFPSSFPPEVRQINDFAYTYLYIKHYIDYYCNLQGISIQSVYGDPSRLHDFNARLSLLEQQSRSTIDQIYSLKEKVR